MNEKELESIFSYAVAMDQSGRMRNTIICGGRDVFILNYDRTILMSFILSKQAGAFPEPIVFDANDYDSSNFYIKNGAVIFESAEAGYVKTKKCGTSKELTYDQISTLYLKRSRKKCSLSFTLRREILNLLQDDLSHIEFHYDDGLKIVQRDIFSGVIIEVRKKETGLGIGDVDVLSEFLPFGIRTQDLEALFQYDRELEFHFNNDLKFFVVKGKTTTLTAILSWCLYDELGRIEKVEE